MRTRPGFTFVVPSNDERILKENFLSSDIFKKNGENNTIQVVIQKGYDSASKAYNDGIKKSMNDILIFCHQDMFFPADWLDNLSSALDFLETENRDWGVIGCYGVTDKKEEVGFLYCNANNGTLGSKFEVPIRVQTLDEIVLVIKKSSNLSFDENIPYYHFYGTDICLQAMDVGKNCYAISAFCIHNSQETTILPAEFMKCYFMIRKKWKRVLPIYASCMRVERVPIRLLKTYFKQWFHELFCKIMNKDKKTYRASDPAAFLKFMK